MTAHPQPLVTSGGILVVDDTPEQLRALVTILGRGGFVARPVKSGRQAIEATVADPPELVLLDMQMPDMSGLEVCSWLKGDVRFRDIPVIFVSGRHSAEDKMAAFRVGGVDYVTKPFHDVEVLVRVRTHLRSRQAMNVLEQKQHYAERTMEIISRTAKDAILMIDNEGRVVHWNHAAEKMFGYCADDVMGQDLYQLVIPQRLREEARTDFSGAQHSTIEHDVGRTFEAFALRRSGEEFPVEVSLTNTHVDGAWWQVGIVRDTSERKQLELELQHARKLEAVGQLAAGIAHEINTPVQFVGDNLQFLSDSFADLLALLPVYGRALKANRLASTSADHEELQALETKVDVDFLVDNVPKALASCSEGIERVSKIVRAMKNFAHPDQPEKVPADINQALQTTLTIARNEYKYVAEIATDFGELPAVPCHIGDLNQVFLNLIVNAAHAIADKTGDSSERGLITVSTRQAGDAVTISIADTGVGIPETIHNRIFEPFFTTKAPGRGSGQGLAISRTIVVDRHGGSLTFVSELGRGTTFTIELPLDPLKSAKPGHP